MTLDLELHRLWTYEFWANRETLASLRRADARPPQRAVQIMAHVIGASRLWLTRMTGATAKTEVWPANAIEQLPADLDALESAWRDWLNAPVPARLDDVVSYINSKGEPWTSTARDILTHLVLHSAYHRGQIATLLGQVKQDAAYTDLIHATRQGLL